MNTSAVIGSCSPVIDFVSISKYWIQSNILTFFPSRENANPELRRRAVCPAIQPCGVLYTRLCRFGMAGHSNWLRCIVRVHPRMRSFPPGYCVGRATGSPWIPGKIYFI